jgi:glycosyltransferase involved in cell wall biosynthesis
MVLLEALHFGLPVLATDCEFGPADVVTDPAIGRLVAPDDVAALAEGLRATVGRPAEPAAESVRRTLAASYAVREVAGLHLAALAGISGSR